MSALESSEDNVTGGSLKSRRIHRRVFLIQCELYSSSSLLSVSVSLSESCSKFGFNYRTHCIFIFFLPRFSHRKVPLPVDSRNPGEVLRRAFLSQALESSEDSVTGGFSKSRRSSPSCFLSSSARFIGRFCYRRILQIPTTLPSRFLNSSHPKILLAEDSPNPGEISVAFSVLKAMYSVKSSLLLSGLQNNVVTYQSCAQNNGIKQIGMVTHRTKRGFALKTSRRIAVIKAKTGDEEYNFNPAGILLKSLLRRVDEETKTLKSIISVRSEHVSSLDLNDVDDLQAILFTLEWERSLVENLMLLRIMLGWVLSPPPNKEILDAEVSSLLEETGADQEEVDSLTLDKAWSLSEEKMKGVKRAVQARIDFEMTIDVTSPTELFKLSRLLIHEEAALIALREAKLGLSKLTKSLILPSLEDAQKEFDICTSDLNHLREVKDEIEKLPHKNEVEYDFLDDYSYLEERAIKRVEDSKIMLDKVKNMEDTISD
ncbi:unnamed protein product [Microthlaspi erraticum]|uniref:Uncharacterized protein n=1 Tax=Microthlaspi erraticum TaxID=1685480 RepID=A0A6D2JUY4_9BRAS|nr:unnamed protein product [Microthlaspi erraticum]